VPTVEDLSELTCGTCFHYKRNPMDPANPTAYVCMRRAATVVLQIAGNAIGGVVQAYPSITDRTPACGDHETHLEYHARHGMIATWEQAAKMLTGAREQ
jgi:hypothetical protein